MFMLTICDLSKTTSIPIRQVHSYEVLDPEQAFELRQQFETHYTQKKGHCSAAIPIKRL
jgi:hypothetical protein